MSDDDLIDALGRLRPARLPERVRRVLVETGAKLPRAPAIMPLAGARWFAAALAAGFVVLPFLIATHDIASTRPVRSVVAPTEPSAPLTWATCVAAAAQGDEALDRVLAAAWRRESPTLTVVGDLP